MLAQRPPMGWNSWNTFGLNVSDTLIREMADVMEREGYLEAGYEYINIDDGWMLRRRDAEGKLIPDPEKFPDGIKELADYVHSKGFKLGIYSCAGLLTCGGFPGSYGHEYSDAEQFAEWGIDLLKYDYCNFPECADGRTAFLTMSVALRATGREILFSACTWGYDEPGEWSREIGAHMYRSDGDIEDNYISFRDISMRQIKKLNHNAAGCFNDMDMLTIGMFGKGHVSKGEDRMTADDYKTLFAFWCFTGSPLIMGGDVRGVDEEMASLLKHKGLIAINQDKECRPPALVYGYKYQLIGAGGSYIMVRVLEGNEVAIGFFNFNEGTQNMRALFPSCGIPTDVDYGLDLTDVISGEALGICKDYLRVNVPAHGFKVYRGKLTHIQGRAVTICASVD